MSAITAIRIPAKFHPPVKEGVTYTGGFHPPVSYKTAEFKLGKGPCGETVTRLHLSVDDTSASVHQYTEGGGFKEFLYFAKDITGRIEVTREGVPG